jgi:cathepsin C
MSIDDMKYVVKIKDYGYIGGRYGSGNTSNIMKEIMENGPVVLSFEPDYFFSLYSQGVY